MLEEVHECLLFRYLFNQALVTLRLIPFNDALNLRLAVPVPSLALLAIQLGVLIVGVKDQDVVERQRFVGLRAQS